MMNQGLFSRLNFRVCFQKKNLFFPCESLVAILHKQKTPQKGWKLSNLNAVVAASNRILNEIKICWKNKRVNAAVKNSFLKAWTFFKKFLLC